MQPRQTNAPPHRSPGGTIRTITFDFWSTLVDGLITPERTVQRLARLHEVIVGAGHRCTLEELHAAFERALTGISERQRETLEDVGPPGRWAAIARELGIPEGLVAYEIVEKTYDDLTLNPLPDATPHVHEALDVLRERGYRLGVICNTGMAGGRVLREVLVRHGLMSCFEAAVFSNELGYSKPDPRIFFHTLELLGEREPAHSLHVGDMEDLDVDGALATGVHAALYAPDAAEPPRTRAELVVRDWRDFPNLVAEL